MNFLRIVFLGLIALILLVLALANREMVTLRLLPSGGMEELVGTGAISLPLFLVIFLAIALGLLIGFVWEWLREHKHRAEAARQRAEKEKLQDQLTRVKGGTEEDEVLALLDGPRA